MLSEDVAEKQAFLKLFRTLHLVVYRKSDQNGQNNQEMNEQVALHDFTVVDNFNLIKPIQFM